MELIICWPASVLVAFTAPAASEMNITWRICALKSDAPNRKRLQIVSGVGIYFFYLRGIDVIIAGRDEVLELQIDIPSYYYHY